MTLKALFIGLAVSLATFVDAEFIFYFLCVWTNMIFAVLVSCASCIVISPLLIRCFGKDLF